MPTIDLTDAELAAVTAAIRRLIEQDPFPRAPRLDLLRSALAKLDPAVALQRAPDHSRRQRRRRQLGRNAAALGLAAFLSPSLAAMLTHAPHRSARGGDL